MRRSMIRRPLSSALQIELAAIAAARRVGAFLWYARPDTASAYQDTAATPAAASGDAVGGLLDRISTVRAAQQTTAAARPTIARDGLGRLALLMTTSQYLTADVTPNGAGSFVIGTTAMTASTNRAPIGCRLSSSSDRFFVNHSAANTVTLSVGASAGVASATVVDGAPCVLSSTAIEGGNTYLWNNGALAGSAAVSGTVKPTSAFAIGGLNTAGSVSFIAGMPMSLVCLSDKVIPDAERIAIERLACLVTGATYAG